MLQTNCIVIDGLPGSGKTTTAEWLVTQLQQNGIKNRYLPEGVTVLWQDVQELTDAIFDEYHIRKLMIETSVGNWPAYRQRISDFLELHISF